MLHELAMGLEHPVLGYPTETAYDEDGGDDNSAAAQAFEKSVDAEPLREVAGAEFAEVVVGLLACVPCFSRPFMIYWRGGHAW